jgi:hypothetical protein
MDKNAWRGKHCCKSRVSNLKCWYLSPRTRQPRYAIYIISSTKVRPSCHVGMPVRYSLGFSWFRSLYSSCSSSLPFINTSPFTGNTRPCSSPSAVTCQHHHSALLQTTQRAQRRGGSPLKTFVTSHLSVPRQITEFSYSLGLIRHYFLSDKRTQSIVTLRIGSNFVVWQWTLPWLTSRSKY